MNKLTRKIRDKGYSLDEFCKANSISLRTYRRHEKENHPKHADLVGVANNTENIHQRSR